MRPIVIAAVLAASVTGIAKAASVDLRYMAPDIHHVQVRDGGVYLLRLPRPS